LSHAFDIINLMSERAAAVDTHVRDDALPTLMRMVLLPLLAPARARIYRPAAEDGGDTAGARESTHGGAIPGSRRHVPLVFFLGSLPSFILPNGPTPPPLPVCSSFPPHRRRLLFLLACCCSSISPLPLPCLSTSPPRSPRRPGLMRRVVGAARSRRCRWGGKLLP
jgi:hypothetical protein